LANGFTFYNVNAKVGFMRNVIIRTATRGLMVVIVFGENDPSKIEGTLQFLSERFPEITSLNYVVNLKVNDTIADQEVVCFKGEPYLTENMDDLTFRIAPKSFFQTNTEQAIRLYRETLALAGLKGNETVYDLYTGTGTIANFLAKKAKKVIGIEYVADAIEDAKVNSQINGISNTTFYAGDMKKILTSEFVYKEGNPDVIVTDPPRGGMEKEVVELLLRVVPKRIVYVSCNPATQARDIALLSEKYEVKVVQPVDMFPHTHHVESIALLQKR
jgi:23S rRNA (uracil1939-C5)-methyltransferase